MIIALSQFPDGETRRCVFLNHIMWFELIGDEAETRKCVLHLTDGKQLQLNKVETRSFTSQLLAILNATQQTATQPQIIRGPATISQIIPR